MSLFNIVGLAALLGALLQPLHIAPWVSWHSEVLAFVAALTLAAGSVQAAFRANRTSILLPVVAWPLLFLVLVVVVQTLAGTIVFFGDGLVLFLYLALCLMALTVRMDDKMVVGLAITLLVAALCSVMLSFTQAFKVWESVTWIVQADGVRRPGANLGQPNQLATLLLMGMASLVYLFESRRMSAPLASFLTVLLLMGVAATESRTGLIGALLLGLWVVVSRGKTELRTLGVAVFVAFLGLTATMWGWPQFVTFVQGGGVVQGATAQHVNVTVGSRMVVWPQIIEAAMQRPWFGWGLREVSKAHNAVLHAYAVGEPFTYAHSIVLELAIGVGFPIAAGLLWVVSAWFIRRMRAVKTLTPWFCIAVVLPFATHSMLEFPFAYAYFLLPVMLAIAALEQTLGDAQPLRLPWTIAVAGLGLSALLMLWSAVEYVQVEEDFRVVRFEAMRIGKTEEDYARPQMLLLTQFAALLEVSRWTPQPNMGAERIEQLRKVAMRFPWTATQNRYALALALNGQGEEARRQIRVMRAMHGEKTHVQLMGSWKSLAGSKYPEILDCIVP